MNNSNGIEFIPDSATGYKVLRDGEEIGRVERSTREKLWYYYTRRSSYKDIGTRRTRGEAVECLIELS